MPNDSGSCNCKLGEAAVAKGRAALGRVPSDLFFEEYLRGLGNLLQLDSVLVDYMRTYVLDRFVH